MMKRVLVGLAALLCVMLVTIAAGCGGGGSSGSASPGQVVKDFWTAVSRGDAQAAYDLFSSEDKAALSYEDFSAMFEGPAEEPINVEIVSEKISGDSATVGASFEGATLDFDLVRQEGSWKLDGIASVISRAEKGAGEAACFDNLRTIDGAIMQYSAANNGSYPQTIEELIPNYIRKMPVCPEGGVYTMTTGGRVPDVRCSIHGDY
jgi:hypothetical protein